MSADNSISSDMKNRKIPFMAIEFPDEENEKIQFEIVNDEQKGIPKSHLKFINRGAHFAGMVADAFREAEDSVFCGRIGIAKRAEWDLITFGSAEEIVAYTFDAFFCQNSFKPDASMEDRARGLRIALLYWQAVKECFPVMWADMDKMTYCKTSNRSVLGIMNQFTFQAESYRDHFGLVDPLALSVKLAGTPCSPLYKGAICPDLAVREVMAQGIVH